MKVLILVIVALSLPAEADSSQGNQPPFIRHAAIGVTLKKADLFRWTKYPCEKDIAVGCQAKLGKSCECYRHTVYGQKDKAFQAADFLVLEDDKVVEHSSTFNYSYSYTLPTLEQRHLSTLESVFGETRPDKITQEPPGADGLIPVRLYWSTAGVEAFAIALCKPIISAGTPLLRDPVRNCGFTTLTISQVRSIKQVGSISNATY